MSCNCSSCSDLSLLKETLDHYSSVPGSLITILQKAQAIYGYLPSDVLNHIASVTGIPAAKVFGVATFYTQFRFKPVGKYLIMLCQGTACHVNGSIIIKKTIIYYVLSLFFYKLYKIFVDFILAILQTV